MRGRYRNWDWRHAHLDCQAGNMTCRAPTTSAGSCTTSSQTGQPLGFDNEGQLTAWQNTPSSPSTTDAFLYDGEGHRIEQQVTSGLPASPNTTTTVYIGDLEDVQTTGSSVTTTTYYALGTQRLALAVNGTVSYTASDALGSATVAFDAATAVPTAATLYAPYGTTRYSSGTMPGSYGFTGQRSDAAVTGLDYYGARYYDPAAAQFVSADSILPGDGHDVWGLSRYAYVEGNPLVRVDPTGHDWWSNLKHAASSVASTVGNVAQAAAPAVGAVLDATTGIPSMINDVHTIFFDSNASGMDKLLAGGDLLLNATMDVTSVIGVGEGMRAAYVGAKVAAHEAVEVGEHVVAHAGEDAVEHTIEHEAETAAEHGAESGACAMSFSADTPVATADGGTRAIATLNTGGRVLAYDPTTGKAGPEPVTATSLHRDANPLDVTLRVVGSNAGIVVVPGAKAPGRSTSAVNQAGQVDHSETIHTTTNHPWYTADHGWLPAGFLRVGERVVRADGTTAMVAAVRVVAGVADMWDLTVGVVHTFAVGSGRYMVHNCPKGDDWGDGRQSNRRSDRDRLGVDPL